MQLVFPFVSTGELMCSSERSFVQVPCSIILQFHFPINQQFFCDAMRGQVFDNVDEIDLCRAMLVCPWAMYAWIDLHGAYVRLSGCFHRQTYGGHGTSTVIQWVHTPRERRRGLSRVLATSSACTAFLQCGFSFTYELITCRRCFERGTFVSKFVSCLCASVACHSCIVRGLLSRSSHHL